MKPANFASVIPIVLALAFSLAAAGFRDVAGTTKPAWKTFTSKSEHLSVLMPSAPEASERHNKTFVGDIVSLEHKAKDGLDVYTVDYTILPSFAISFSGRDGIYQHARNAVLKNTFSKPISYTSISLNGVHGMKLVYDTPSKPAHPEMHGEARFFLIDDHLYTVDAVVEMKGASEKLEHFFSSLKISD